MSAAQRVLSAIITLFVLAACSPSAPTRLLRRRGADDCFPPPRESPNLLQLSVQPDHGPGQTDDRPAAAPTTAPAAQPTAAAKPATIAPVSGEIVVFAASSLTDVFQDLATTFQQANPNTKLTFNFGSSSQLATQLGQGVSADVFASATPPRWTTRARPAPLAARTRSSPQSAGDHRAQGQSRRSPR